MPSLPEAGSPPHYLNLVNTLVWSSNTRYPNGQCGSCHDGRRGDTRGGPPVLGHAFDRAVVGPLSDEFTLLQRHMQYHRAQSCCGPHHGATRALGDDPPSSQCDPEEWDHAWNLQDPRTQPPYGLSKRPKRPAGGRTARFHRAAAAGVENDGNDGGITRHMGTSVYGGPHPAPTCSRTHLGFLAWCRPTKRTTRGSESAQPKKKERLHALRNQAEPMHQRKEGTITPRMQQPDHTRAMGKKGSGHAPTDALM